MLSELSTLIEKISFLPGQAKSDSLIKLHAGLFPNFTKLEFDFGFVWMFEDRLVFYFKPDFELGCFYKFFWGLYPNYKISWAALEVFDKNIKILEIFSKTSLLRSFRNESDLFGKKYKPTQTTIDCHNNDFLFFLTKYDTKNLKLVLHFISSDS